MLHKYSKDFNEVINIFTKFTSYFYMIYSNKNITVVILINLKYTICTQKLIIFNTNTNNNLSRKKIKLLMIFGFLLNSNRGQTF